ncbi:MAG: helix-turn-helix domain-containing protein [Cyclobacteriaceae bacterium]
MKAYQLHIKNMVCDRCIYFVEQALKQLRIYKCEVELGQVSFLSSKNDIEERLELKLSKVGLSILRTNEEILLEAIKHEVSNYLDTLEQGGRKKALSAFLQKRLARNYHYLCRFFKDAEQTTLEFYVIAQKVERAKRFIRENELTLKEIAEQLHYSSLQHLSAQFRQITGITATQFKKQAVNKPNSGSISDALASLKTRGYFHHFEIRGKSLWYDQATKTVSLKNVALKEVYRFEDKPVKYGSSVIYEVETSKGVKGYMICQQ